MNCGEITKRVNRLATISEKIQGGKVEALALLSLQNNAEEVIEEIYDHVGLSGVLSTELNREENWQKLGAYFESKSGNLFSEDFFQRLNEFFNIKKFYIEVNDYDYERFIRKLVNNDFVRQKFEQYYPPNRFSTPKWDFLILLRLINSLYLTIGLNQDAQLSVRDLPEELKNSYGCFMARGIINLDKGGDGCGLEMSGGRLNIEETTGRVGEEMSGGIIDVGVTSRETGYHMSGGKIIVGKHIGGNFGYESDHGVLVCEETDNAAGPCSTTDILINKAGDNLGANKNGGVIVANYAGFSIGRFQNSDPWKRDVVTILVGEYKDTIALESKMRTFKRDSDGRYFGLNASKPDNNISTDSELSEFKSGKSGLVIIDDPDLYDQNITEGLQGGIIVLRKLPKDGLGKGIKSGVVIIEIPGITKEEIKSRMSSERQYDHGLILMPVDDPEHPGKTKLVDVEL